MPIKNYTTEISAMKSIGQIQGSLVAHGAKAIMINFSSDKEPENLSFIIPTPSGDVPFQLPANVQKLEELLLKQLTSSTYRRWDSEYQQQKRQKMHEQAIRVAWRIIKDWIDAQVAIIETDMVTIEQVFLPYMLVDEKRTLYGYMIEKGFYLPEGRG